SNLQGNGSSRVAGSARRRASVRYRKQALPVRRALPSAGRLLRLLLLRLLRLRRRLGLRGGRRRLLRLDLRLAHLLHLGLGVTATDEGDGGGGEQQLRQSGHRITSARE